jgi:predicted dithiol-disulfide oxidoreductase (DUF899 family)
MHHLRPRTREANQYGSCRTDQEVMTMPEVVPETQWRAALAEITEAEKRATRERDALAARRRRLPAVAIEKPYTFAGPGGPTTLLDLFADRRQLLLYHFMFGPGAPGWPDAGCPGCSMFVDQIGHPAHFHARNTSLALVSLAPLEKIEAYRERMGWTLPWYSSAGSDFNRDFGVTTDQGETFGLSVFYRDDEKRILRTYFTDRRGVEALGSVWTFLDLTLLGRQEEWEDSPAGTPQGPTYTWWRRHVEYANEESHQ